MEVCLEISEETVAKLESRVAESEFESLSEYVEFVLDEVVAPRPELDPGDHEIEGREEEVRDQLRSLGYIE